jgi:glycosyltransferase involved in cell wall biosynthesis
MTDPAPNVALYFDPDGFVEQTRPSGRADGPAGLMGRQVAGKEFLDAYLAHGRWDSLAAVVRSRDRAEPLVALCKSHPSSRARRRRLQIVEESEFLPKFAPADRPAELLHFPCPPDARFAWMRHAAAPGAFALCGVTHTLSTPAAAAALCELLSAPFEPFDALVCTSRAVVETVKAVTGSFADYLRDRFGGSPALRPRLELVPLGVNVDRFRPPTPEERALRRRELGVADDEVMVLCVGRLSHHAKAHPFPVFHAAQQAARRTGRKVHLLFAGWAAHPAVGQEYRSAAHYFAPAVRVSFADGQDPAVRAAVWPAADVFVSLPDNVQETFGLVVVEAMASGLPVVGSDWDGYRDLVADGETGLLVPTRMVRGATAGATARVLFGQVNYDHFLAECSQAAAVDPAAAADALTRLVGDDALRRQMGEAGRRRAVAEFGWERVVRAYETLWAEQQAELARRRAAPGAAPAPSPARYPPPERSFAAYPTAWVGDSEAVQASEGATARLPGLLAMPLTSLAADRRARDAGAITELLRAAAQPRPVGELAAMLERSGTAPDAARATVAWLLKYDLLRIID